MVCVQFFEFCYGIYTIKCFIYAWCFQGQDSWLCCIAITICTDYILKKYLSRKSNIHHTMVCFAWCFHCQDSWLCCISITICREYIFLKDVISSIYSCSSLFSFTLWLQFLSYSQLIAKIKLTDFIILVLMGIQKYFFYLIIS